jgi:adenosylmethionine-8-amino-7-oxononanoate aminotransferase
LLCGKGISSGYLPLGAVVASARVVDAIANGSGAFTHGFTYNAHPVAVAAGAAVLERIRAQKLVAAADSEIGKVGRALRERLEKLRDIDCVGDVRGIGLLWGVEFVSDKKSKRPFAAQKNFAGNVAATALKRGMLVYPIQGCVDGYEGDHILLAPPAVIKEEEMTWAISELRGAIEEASAA